jgi:uncharacterized protein (TIGR04255 family)
MTYPHAPITEAVIDIRVVPRDNLNVEEFRKLADRFGSEFGTQNDQFRMAGTITFGVPPVPGVTSTKAGIQFIANAKDRLFQAQLDGWTFNKLAPYRGWEEEFRDQARDLWNAYRSVAQPQTITRAALRYVNRLDFPLPVDDLRTYLRTFPEVTPDLPQKLANFFMQLQIPHEDIKALLMLNMTRVPPAREEVVSVVLDLDLFRTDDLPQRDEELWAYFEILRTRKNEIFEACITNATRELFR